MRKVGEAKFKPESALLQSIVTTPVSPEVIIVPSNSGLEAFSTTAPETNWQICEVDDQFPPDSWLPITESRNGNSYCATFHLINSGIGFQALLLPLAFATLGWVWGTIALFLSFVWQLYTTILLVRLHESVPGTRFSRYLFLSMAAFGKRLGKLAALFPVMYLSGGSCVIFIITGGGAIQLFFKTMCDNDNVKSLSGIEWFLVFTFIAIAVAQVPNLNSVSGISLIGAATAICYCTILWALSISKDRPSGVSYRPILMEGESNPAKFSDILNAIGVILLAFRGHNVLLEIQGTLPSNPKHPAYESMSKGVTISYTLIAMVLFPLAAGGFWAYGNKIPSYGGILSGFEQFHRHQVSKFSMGLIYLSISVHCLSTFQVYVMPVFDNLEIRYTRMKKRKCSRLVRTVMRVLFGGLVFFVAVAFPFLPTLSPLLGGLTLIPVTYAYPCFMWISIKKPKHRGFMWWFNMALGWLGMVLGGLLAAAASWNLAHSGINANFFNP